MRRLVIGVMMMLACTSLAYGQNTSANARKAIEANAKAFTAAFNKGDAAAVAAMYATDAKLLQPNGPVVEGRANIQTFWAGGISAGLKMVSLTPVDVTVAGNLAIETGKYATTVPSGGATVTDEGKYVVVWRREGRGWKIIRDIFNSDKPAQ